MDISNATALASTIVALIAPALIQTLKKHIPEGFTAFTTLVFCFNVCSTGSAVFFRSVG